MGRIDMKLLLQIALLAVFGYQTSATIQQLKCAPSRRCEAIGGTCSILPPDSGNWFSAFICYGHGSKCKCWVRSRPTSCNGRCRSRGDQCSKTSPGIGWTNTGQICGTNGCKCWRKSIPQQCHDDTCKATGGLCSEQSPGMGWYKAGHCQGRCSCWRNVYPHCHDDRCKAMGGRCSEQSPGRGWWKVGHCQGRCSCWKTF